MKKLSITTKKYSKFAEIGIILILIIGIFLRYYKLDLLPGDIFGDMSENLNHIASVLKGDLKIIYGFDARECMIFYLVAPFAAIFGNTYLTLKMVMAGVGTIGIFTEYLFVKELFNKKVALIAAFLVAVSKWPITFSRMGFRNILTPMLTALLFYLFLKAQKTGKIGYFLAWGFVTGIGLYSYPAFRFVIVSVGIFALISIFKKQYVKENLIALCLAGLLFLPMAKDYLGNKEQYTAHINPMIYQKDGTIRKDWLKIVGLNIKNQALMYHVKGDIVFRINPVNQPLLDYVSGIFFIFGFLLLFIDKQYRSKSLIIIIPFLLLQFPSIMVLNFPIDIPSFTRSIPLIVYVYMIIALGLEKISKYKLLFVLLLLYIVRANFYNYFVLYQNGLPNHNISFGRYIAEKIDGIEQGRQVFMIGGGWGDWGQPEPNGIRHAISVRKDTQFFDVNDFEISKIKGKSFLVLPPDKKELIGNIKTSKVETFVSKYNEPMFIGVWIDEKK